MATRKPDSKSPTTNRLCLCPMGPLIWSRSGDGDPTLGLEMWWWVSDGDDPCQIEPAFWSSCPGCLAQPLWSSEKFPEIHPSPNTPLFTKAARSSSSKKLDVRVPVQTLDADQFRRSSSGPGAVYSTLTRESSESATLGGLSLSGSVRPRRVERVVPPSGCSVRPEDRTSRPCS